MLCRSGLLFLALVGAFQYEAAADEEAGAVFDNWRSHEQHDMLPDGTVLSEYSAGTHAQDGIDASFRLGFIPRFACTPVIAVVAALGNAEGQGEPRSLADFESVEFSIDGTPIDFPVLVDDDKPVATIYFNGNLQRRIALRVLVDAGNNMSITTRSGELLSFSLLGSTSSLEAALKSCREHVPLPIE